MNKNLKCVIFDLDGTLIDSGPDLLNTLNYVLTENNLKGIDRSVLGNLVGGGAEAMIRRGYKHLNTHLDEKEIPSLIDLFINHYYENCTNQTKLCLICTIFIIMVNEKIN